MSFDIRSMVLGMVGTNCYFYVNKETKETVIFDPADNASRIEAYIRQEQLKPVAILLTHGHFDHMMAAADIADRYKISIYAHEEEQELLQTPALNGCSMIGETISGHADKLVQDGQVLALAGARIEVLFTPGHTKGGVSYYLNESGIIICGDTLFEGSVGRTDLPTGSMGTLIRSIREKLFVLDDDIKVLPGHGGSTTIGWEKKHNPFAAI